MEQKQPDLCVVFSLIDCPGLRLLGVRRVLSEYLLECWEDKNHSLSHHTTEAEWRIQTKSERQRKPTQTGKQGHRGRDTGEAQRGRIINRTYTLLTCAALNASLFKPVVPGLALRANQKMSQLLDLHSQNLNRLASTLRVLFLDRPQMN